MRKTLIITAAIAALATSPALAQGRGAPGGGGPGGPGGGMGAGPPMTPPGQSGGFDASMRAQDIASQRGSFGRDLAEQQRNRLLPEQASQIAQERRALAMQYAQAARTGRTLPPNADRNIRDALKDDIDLWRQEFRVGRSEWQAARDRWIVDRASLTPAQWAQRRADWFATRDTWIAANKTRAQTRGN